MAWTDLGQRDVPHVTHLVLGIDGRNLYAATDGASGGCHSSTARRPAGRVIDRCMSGRPMLRDGRDVGIMNRLDVRAFLVALIRRRVHLFLVVLGGELAVPCNRKPATCRAESLLEVCLFVGQADVARC